MSRHETREFRCYRAVLRLAARALPASTRRLFGDELNRVYQDILRDTYAGYGIAGVRRRMPALLTDACAAIGMEYLDAWRRASRPPLRLAAWSLTGATMIWTLSIVATFAGAGWAVSVLEWHLGTTLTLMLGLPVVSLLTSYPGRVSAGGMQGQCIFNASVALTAVSWSVLWCHVAL